MTFEKSLPILCKCQVEYMSWESLGEAKTEHDGVCVEDGRVNGCYLV
jgi:hypothetical protein